jgi:2-oxoglutarate ferredoxin oxidoreductase subunit beta
VDWHPAHLYATLRTAYRHKGLSFVRILQRCPTYTAGVFEPLRRDASGLLLLEHDDGVQLDPAVARSFPNKQSHDPADMSGARELTLHDHPVPVGLLFRDPTRPCYDSFTQQGLDMTTTEKLAALEHELDRFAV